MGLPSEAPPQEPGCVLGPLRGQTPPGSAPGSPGRTFGPEAFPSPILSPGKHRKLRPFIFLFVSPAPCQHKAGMTPGARILASRWPGQGPWWEGLCCQTHTEPPSLPMAPVGTGILQPRKPPPTPVGPSPLASTQLLLQLSFTYSIRPSSPARGLQVPTTGTLWDCDPANSI